MGSEYIFSKVILAGEHSVLRGGAAVVASNKNYAFEYSLQKSSEFKISYSEDVKKYEILFLGTIKRGLELLGVTKDNLKVSVNIKTIVPLGSGLGGSAALCVFVSKVFSFCGLINEKTVFSFAHDIENMFHGKSSGLDIAGCMSDHLVFYKQGEMSFIKVSAELQGLVFTAHESGESGDTKECIKKVLQLKTKDPKKFKELDAEMSLSSNKLKTGFETGSVDMIVESFNETKSIFSKWGLETENIKANYEELRAKSAIASRLSGSGMGGAVIAVWNKEDLPKDFIDSVFLEF